MATLTQLATAVRDAAIEVRRAERVASAVQHQLNDALETLRARREDFKTAADTLHAAFEALADAAP